MTLAEEKALLRRFTKAAGAGEMLNILELKAAYQAAIGRATRPNQFIIGNHGSREEVIAIRQLALRHAGTPNAARPDWRTPWQSLAVLVRARAVSRRFCQSLSSRRSPFGATMVRPRIVGHVMCRATARHRTRRESRGEMDVPNP